LAIGGLFSVVLVSDHSAWELPSALPMKSGLSSRSVAATSDHPVFSLAPEYYRTGCARFQGRTADASAYCTVGKNTAGTGGFAW
jgi:hypothetical protein